VEKKLAGARPLYDPAAQISEFDIRQEYYQALSNLLDLELLGNTPRILYHETMGGTGAGWLTGFAKFSGLPLTIHELHGVPSPTFYGVNPEPIPQNLKTAMAVLSPESSPVFAAVTDGDADRIGAVLAGGKYFDSHAIFLVLMDHLLKKGGSGRVVKTFPGSRMIELLAQKRGVECQTLPVGFKYVTDEFLKGGVLIGGEESGGIGVAGHIPERDGILNALLLLEATARAGTGLGEIFAALETEVGYPHAYDRLDLHLPDLAAKDRALEQVREPRPLAGLEPMAVDPLDGIKWIYDDGSWLLFRAAGTEPLLRIYCESHSVSQVKELLNAARKLVGM
jgi:phosphomannomutase